MNTQSSGYVIDEANAERLTCWLDAAQWTRREATLLFLDTDPDREYVNRFSTFSRVGEVQYEYYDDDDPQTIVQYGVNEYDEPIYISGEQETLLRSSQKLRNKLEKKLNLYDVANPFEWVELACELKIFVPWLTWAIEKEIFVSNRHFGQRPAIGSEAIGLTSPPQIDTDAPASPVVALPVSESGTTASVLQLPIKKSAMIELHKHVWPTIEQDMKDANRNKLSFAKAGQRGWVELKALEWARANAKLINGDKPKLLLGVAMNTMASSPVSRKHICED